MNNDATTQLATTMGAMVNALTTFTQEQFNTIPFEGSWTAAQVADHIYKSVENTPKVLTGNTTNAGRQPDEFIPVFEKIFLDYSTQLKSPAFIVPTDEPLNKEEMINKLRAKAIEIEQTYKTVDPDELCLDFTFPKLGNVTRQEMMWFIIYHTQRHTHQLQKIADRLK